MRFFLRVTLISLLIGLLPPTLSQSETQQATGVVFRFHIPSEPVSLDPSLLTSSDASYLFQNIGRGLYTYSDKGGLRAEGAKWCKRTGNELRCELSADSSWSDGRRVSAHDYVRTFRKLISIKSKNSNAELLKNLRNFAAVLAGEKPSDELGVRALDDSHLIFEFTTPDPDFLYKLTASSLSPSHLDLYPPRGELNGIVFNGPYRVTNWTPGRRIRLESNPHYHRGQKNRPPVEVLFLDDDQTALNLYETKALSFLRRLPSALIASYRSRPDFVRIPMSRFDYVGFGQDLKDLPDLRAALAHSVDHAELQRLLLTPDVPQIPGCAGLSTELTKRTHCLKFDLEAARRNWRKVPESVRNRRWTFAFSKLGGDDVKRVAEWYQAQWRKNLGFQVDLQQSEQGVFLQALRSSPPAVFRKGVGLDRPTCLAALETFSAEGAENFLKLRDPEFEDLLSRLARLPDDRVGERRKICSQAVENLLQRNLLVPQGRQYFAVLADRRFTGWTLNQMNQLDLSELRTR